MTPTAKLLDVLGTLAIGLLAGAVLIGIMLL